MEQLLKTFLKAAGITPEVFQDRINEIRALVSSARDAMQRTDARLSRIEKALNISETENSLIDNATERKEDRAA